MEKRNDFARFLVLWINTDRDFWIELNDIQIKILIDRIVETQSYDQIAAKYKTTNLTIRMAINNIILKIDRLIDHSIACHIRKINEGLNQTEKEVLIQMPIWPN